MADQSSSGAGTSRRQRAPRSRPKPAPAPEVNPAARHQLDADADPPVRRPEHRESSLTRLIEQQAAKIPSDLFLAAALTAMATSLGCEITGRRRASRFVGMWPGPLLVMGLYNKLVKVVGPR